GTAALRPIVKKDNPKFWAKPLDEFATDKYDEFPAFLMRLPKLNGEYVQASDGYMTLFSMPLMDTSMGKHETTTLWDILVERNVTDPNAIFDSSIVQEKKIYAAPALNHVVCVGLEVKLMADYTVSIYIVADSKSEFGDDAAVFVAAMESPSVVWLHHRDGTATEFIEVVDEDQLRAFASCKFKEGALDVNRDFSLKETTDDDS
ncbi:hypothetical protein As57867_005286, partial [Aphanomyces stellatus]